MFRVRAIVLLVMFASFSTSPGAAEGDLWYTPNYFTIQTAGNLGLVSFGAGSESASKKFGYDVWYGYVPEAFGGIAIHTAAIKARYNSLKLLPVSVYRIRPVYYGIMLSHVFGKQYLSGRYDGHSKEYYYWTNVHLMPHIGIEALYKSESNNVSSLYMEVGVLDVYLITSLLNPNTVRFSETVNISFGLRFYL